MRMQLPRSKLLIVIYVPIVLILVFIIKYDVQAFFNSLFNVPYNVNRAEVPNSFMAGRRIAAQAYSDPVSNKALRPTPVNKSHKIYYFYRRKDLITNVDVTQLDLFHKENPLCDRVVNQLLYIPPNYTKTSNVDTYKKIYLDDGPKAFWKVEYGTSNFQYCPVNSCNIIDDISQADLVVYKDKNPKPKVRPDQLHMVFILESPFHFPSHLKGPFDWTSTYRRDSDIVAPYGQWEYYDKRVTQLHQSVNYAKGKTKKVAWFVSNCGAKNNRLQIAKELSKYISVDIYGACGGQNLECPRSNESACYELLEKDYKFYLSFENSNCRDYVSEKLYRNALQHNVLPIVMGGSPEDYHKMAPERSFIHVDDFANVSSLATYLNLLDKDDVLYNTYFKWKGTGEIIDAHYWCRVCSMLHIPNKDKSKYRLSDVSFRKWWQGEDVCNRSNWKK